MSAVCQCQMKQYCYKANKVVKFEQSYRDTFTNALLDFSRIFPIWTLYFVCLSRIVRTLLFE